MLVALQPSLWADVPSSGRSFVLWRVYVLKTIAHGVCSRGAVFRTCDYSPAAVWCSAARSTCRRCPAKRGRTPPAQTWDAGGLGWSMSPESTAAVDVKWTPLVRVSRVAEPRSHARDRLTCQLTCVAGGLRALSGQCVLCFKQVATDNQKSTDSRLNTARSINFKLFYILRSTIRNLSTRDLITKRAG